MPIARISVWRRSGSAHLEFELQNGEWTIGGNGAVEAEPGLPIYLDNWRVGAQSCKIRQFGFSGKLLIVDSDYGETLQWRLYLGANIPSGEPVRLLVRTKEQRGEGRVRFQTGADLQDLDIGNGDWVSPIISLSV
ncbi:MAG TPA: hypothetical protein VH877_17195 [Polyangia bacterium]|jgi:hypothetical protein|nr:hypothetical protein [Polyangia bacterium]